MKCLNTEKFTVRTLRDAHKGMHASRAPKRPKTRKPKRQNTAGLGMSPTLASSRWPTF